MSSRNRFLAACALVLVASPLVAQRPEPMLANAPVDSMIAAAPMVASAEPAVSDLGVVVAEHVRNGPLMQQGLRGQHAAVAALAPADRMKRERMNRNPALMLIGGAAMVVGAVIGGDAGTIVMVGGGIVGLYGLWHYVQ